MDLNKLRDTIIRVLTILSTFLGRVPMIGPVISLLLTLVTQFWPEVEAILKKFPPHLVNAVLREGRPLMGNKAADDPTLSLVAACEQIAGSEE